MYNNIILSNNELININSKKGKKLIYKYLSKIQGGTVNKSDIHKLQWGLGIEKEFPIIIGPYSYNYLKKITKIILEKFNISFESILKNNDNPISQELNNIKQKIEIDNNIISESNENLTIGKKLYVLKNICKSNIEKTFDNFYINYTNLYKTKRNLFINYFNEDYLSWITKKIVLNDYEDNITTYLFKKYNICLINFISEFDKYNDFLYKYIFYNFISYLSDTIEIFFEIYFKFEIPNYDEKADKVYTYTNSTQWMQKWFNIIRVYNTNAYTDRTLYKIKRLNYYGYPEHNSNTIKKLSKKITLGFKWCDNDEICKRITGENKKKKKQQNQCYNMEENLIIFLHDHRVESDLGGTEIRSFDENNEAYKNKDINKYVDNILEKEKKLYDQLNTLFSEQEKSENPNLKIYFQNNYTSYYKPILTLFKKTFYQIVLKEVYSGENEINITLPYIEFYDLSIDNINLYSLPEATDLPKCSPIQILNKINNDEYIDILNVIDDEFIKEETEENKKLLKELKIMYFDYTKIFRQKHINLMKVLQLLSPLFLSSFTGIQYFSFGDKFNVPESSKRFKYLGYRILTEQDIDNIYNEQDYYDIKCNSIIKEILNEKDIKSDDNAFEFSVNRKDNKYDPENNKFFGFEWKVLDQYPTEYIPNIILLVIMLAQYIENLNQYEIINGKVNDLLLKYFSKSDLKKWLEEIIFQGWNSSVNKSYIELVKETLHITVSEEYTETCYDYLNSIYHYLINYFKTKEYNTTILTCFFPSFFDEFDEKLTNLPNINKKNYINMMEDFKYYFPECFNEVKDIVNDEKTHEDYIDFINYEVITNN